jgi:GNAT superfamily N-acetyltransferase
VAFPIRRTPSYIDARPSGLEIPPPSAATRVPAALDDPALYARMHANLREFCRLMGSASPGARVVELSGVVAAVVPATPHRSLFNSVAYDTAGQLAQALPRLADIYTDAGIEAWTVWTPERDDRAARLLSEAGHRIDGDPAVMCMELSDLRVPRPDDLDLDPDPRVAMLSELNDAAYGTAPDMAHAVQTLPGVTLHVARLDGRPAGAVGTYDLNGDTCILYVATAPVARGRGVASKLVALALHEARDRGATTTSLQATKMGYPIYAKLGYRDLGKLQMWERREPRPQERSELGSIGARVDGP